MEDLVLIGGGGHCRSCIDVVERENKFKILGILDNNLELGTTVLEYEVIGDDNSIEKFCQIRRGGGVTFLVSLGQIKKAMPIKRGFVR
ncbi:MAG: hypothetical protein LBQ08_02555, partial [Holosporaceae bacterium]|nr:hypothetical protein [Holosporaceae bacterium]